MSINHYHHLTQLPTSSSLTFWEQIQWVRLIFCVPYPAALYLYLYVYLYHYRYSYRYLLLPPPPPSSSFLFLSVRDEGVSTIISDHFSYIFPSLCNLFLLFIVPLFRILTYHLFYLVVNTEKRKNIFITTHVDRSLTLFITQIRIAPHV